MKKIFLPSILALLVFAVSTLGYFVFHLRNVVYQETTFRELEFKVTEVKLKQGKYYWGGSCKIECVSDRFPPRMWIQLDAKIKTLVEDELHQPIGGLMKNGKSEIEFQLYETKVDRDTEIDIWIIPEHWQTLHPIKRVEE